MTYDQDRFGTEPGSGGSAFGCELMQLWTHSTLVSLFFRGFLLHYAKQVELASHRPPRASVPKSSLKNSPVPKSPNNWPEAVQPIFENELPKISRFYLLIAKGGSRGSPQPLRPNRCRNTFGFAVHVRRCGGATAVLRSKERVEQH